MSTNFDLFFKTKIIDKKKDNFRLQIVLSPIELNFGNILGNLIRRILLRQISCYSFVGYKMQNLLSKGSFVKRHSQDEFGEFDARLSQVKVKELVRGLHGERLNVSFIKQGPYSLYSKDLNFSDSVICLNPELFLMEIPYGIQIEFLGLMKKGVGFILSNTHSDLPKHFVGINSYFNPIIHVSYSVKTYSIYEELILYIETDGRIDPICAFEECMLFLKSKLLNVSLR